MVWIVDDKAQREGSDASLRFFSTIDYVVASSSSSAEFVAFDCEGVQLGRCGSIEIVSLCFQTSGHGMSVYLVDLGRNSTRDGSGGGKLRNQRIQALKKLFECTSVTKVIHDCRMDCDALYHFFGIELTNVRDTSCFHYVITGQHHKSLNDVLLHNHLEVNNVRDNSIYKLNPKFWASRPLSKKMISWASSDVDKLLDVAIRQIRSTSKSSSLVSMAQEMSSSYTMETVNMKTVTGLQCKKPIGLFIGAGGKNLKQLREQTGIGKLIQQESGWTVYYNHPSQLAAVKRALGHS